MYYTERDLLKETAHAIMEAKNSRDPQLANLSCGTDTVRLAQVQSSENQESERCECHRRAKIPETQEERSQFRSESWRKNDVPPQQSGRRNRFYSHKSLHAPTGEDSLLHLASLNVNVIQKHPHTQPQNTSWSNVRASFGPLKVTHKINHLVRQTIKPINIA